MNADITPLILTYNEHPNISRTLAALEWASQIVAVDSGSTDGTLEILRANPKVRVFHRPFDTHANQWNFAVRETGVAAPWVLALDADHVVTAELAAELQTLEPPETVGGYRATFTYVLEGRRLWGSLYPPAVVLFRPGRAVYRQDGHTQRLHVEGEIRELQGRILHDDRKPFSRWLAAQRNYMVLESKKLRASPWRELSWPDRVRTLVVVAPPLALLYCLFWKGCILQGRAGLQYTFQRTIAEAILSVTLFRSLLRRR